MTVSAYIFFTIELGKTQDVVKKLRKIPNIVRVAIVTGEYDVIARINVENLEELFHITTNNIHMIEGITNIFEKWRGKVDLE